MVAAVSRPPFFLTTLVHGKQHLVVRHPLVRWQCCRFTGHMAKRAKAKFPSPQQGEDAEFNSPRGDEPITRSELNDVIEDLRTNNTDAVARA